MAGTLKSDIFKFVRSIFSGDAHNPDTENDFYKRCEDIDGRIAELRKREHELYSDIGAAAIAKYGAAAFDALGQTFADVQDSIRGLESEKAALLRAQEEARRAAEEARRAAEEAARAVKQAEAEKQAQASAPQAAVPEGDKPASPAPACRICPVCGGSNDSRMKFCGECGARLPTEAPLICPVCGYENTSGAKFCGECGTRLQIDAAPKPAVQDTRSGASMPPMDEPNFDEADAGEGACSYAAKADFSEAAEAADGTALASGTEDSPEAENPER